MVEASFHGCVAANHSKHSWMREADGLIFVIAKSHGPPSFREYAMAITRVSGSSNGAKKGVQCAFVGSRSRIRLQAWWRPDAFLLSERSCQSAPDLGILVSNTRSLGHRIHMPQIRA